MGRKILGVYTLMSKKKKKKVRGGHAMAYKKEKRKEGKNKYRKRRSI